MEPAAQQRDEEVTRGKTPMITWAAMEPAAQQRNEWHDLTAFITDIEAAMEPAAQQRDELAKHIARLLAEGCNGARRSAAGRTVRRHTRPRK